MRKLDELGRAAAETVLRNRAKEKCPQFRETRESASLPKAVGRVLMGPREP